MKFMALFCLNKVSDFFIEAGIDLCKKYLKLFVNRIF